MDFDDLGLTGHAEKNSPFRQEMEKIVRNSLDRIQGEKNTRIRINTKGSGGKEIHTGLSDVEIFSGKSGWIATTATRYIYFESKDVVDIFWHRGWIICLNGGILYDATLI